MKQQWFRPGIPSGTQDGTPTVFGSAGLRAGILWDRPAAGTLSSARQGRRDATNAPTLVPVISLPFPGSCLGMPAFRALPGLGGTGILPIRDPAFRGVQQRN